MKRSRLWCLLLVSGVSAWAETNSLPLFQVETGREYLLAVAEALPAQAGTNADTYFLRAQAQSQLGHKDEAERLARLALACQTNRADLDLFLANLFIRQDRLDEAAALLRKAVSAQPDLPTSYTQLGMVLDRLGDRPAAEQALLEAVRRSPNDATARLLLGRLLLDQGRDEDALAQLRKACQLDPKLPRAWYALYQAQTKHQDAEAAKKTLQTFRQLEAAEQAETDATNAASDNSTKLRNYIASFHVAAAALLTREGQSLPAEAHLLQATRIAPEETTAYEKLAAFYLGKEQWSSARQVLEALTRRQPNRADYGVNLGTALVQLQDLPAAVNQFKRVLELNPNQPAALHNLARLYLGCRQELPQALALCQRLVATDPQAANYDLLGWALYANGRTNEALAAAGTAVAKEPANALYQERHRRLRQAAGANH